MQNRGGEVAIFEQGGAEMGVGRAWESGHPPHFF